MTDGILNINEHQPLALRETVGAEERGLSKERLIAVVVGLG